MGRNHCFKGVGIATEKRRYNLPNPNCAPPVRFPIKSGLISPPTLFRTKRATDFSTKKPTNKGGFFVRVTSTKI